MKRQTAYIVTALAALLAAALIILLFSGPAYRPEAAPITDGIHPPVETETAETEGDTSSVSLAADTLKVNAANGGREAGLGRPSMGRLTEETATPEQTPEPTPEPWWTEEDWRIITNVVRHEAPWCSDRQQQLTAQVLVNRVFDPRFPGTVRGVVCAPGQYSEGYVYGLPPLDTPDEETQRCFENVRAVLEGRVDCPPDVVYQANFRQGTGVYEICEVDTGWFASTTYFCYG